MKVRSVAQDGLSAAKPIAFTCGGFRFAQPTLRRYSAAFAVLPNIRVGAAKPQEVPSVTLT